MTLVKGFLTHETIVLCSIMLMLA